MMLGEEGRGLVQGCGLPLLIGSEVVLGGHDNQAMLGAY